MKLLRLLATVAVLFAACVAHAQLRLHMVSHDIFVETGYNPEVGHNYQPVAGTFHFETFLIKAQFAGDPLASPWNQWHAYGDLEGLGHFDLRDSFTDGFNAAALPEFFAATFREDFGLLASFTFQPDFTWDPAQNMGSIIAGAGDVGALVYANSVTLTPVPEPATYAFAGSALLLLALGLRTLRTSRR